MASLLATLARAELPAEPFRPPTAGPWVAFTAHLPDPGELNLQPLFFHRTLRGALDGRGVLTGAASGDWTGELELYVEAGLLPRLSVGLQPSVVYHRRAVDSESGIADTLLFSRVAVVRETVGATPELTVITQVRMPTSTLRDFGTAPDVPPPAGTWDLSAGLSASKGVRPLLLHAEVLFSRPLAANEGGRSFREGSYLVWAAAAELVSERRRVALVAELTGLHQARTRLNRVVVAGTDSRELSLGLSAQLLVSRNLQLAVGVQRTLAGRNTDAFQSVALTLNWSR
ncbi:MAG: hypothetical protein ACK4N5_21165 [Myxococcales bacterium]